MTLHWLAKSGSTFFDMLKYFKLLRQLGICFQERSTTSLYAARLFVKGEGFR